MSSSFLGKKVPDRIFTFRVAYSYKIHLKYTKRSLGRKREGTAFPRVPTVKSTAYALLFAL